MHLGNIAQGATVSNSIVQAITATLSGFYFAVLFVCTGSALPGIILHSLYDFICFAGDASLTNGILTNQLKTWEIVYNIVIDLVVAGYGAFMLKKIVAPKILEIWREKWSLDKEKLIEG
jgi:hypothetical protein